MERSKIDFRREIVSTFLWLSVILSIFSSCDVLEPDPDVVKPVVKVKEEQVFVLSNNSVFIDLNAKISTNAPVRVRVTSATKFGELADLGKGLLQYTPSVGHRRAEDAFSFSVSTENNTIIESDTVTITIETDSAALPCGIFPSDDYVYGVKKNEPVGIPVLSNDYICGVDSADLAVSIYRPDDTFPPFAGSAEVLGQTVFYTPGADFTGFDRVMYKVQPPNEPGTVYYGMVYIAGDTRCPFFVRDDTFQFDIDSLTHMLTLPVLQNDSLCQNASNYQFLVARQPQYGTATTDGQRISYQLVDSDTLPPVVNDHLFYELCIDGVCKTARVDVRFSEGVSACVFEAVPDTVDLSGNSIPLIYFDVLYNDRVCEGYTSFAITQSPIYGSAFISQEYATIGYERNFETNKNDSLEYQICNTEKCSRAKVFIKREK